MNIYKNDRDYGAAAGDATLGGAVYRVYYPQGTGETYSDITTDETGFAMVENMPFGQIRDAGNHSADRLQAGPDCTHV